MRKIIAANWKMNKTAGEAQVLLSQILENHESVPADVEMVLAVPFIYLKEFARKVHDLRGVKVAAQNCHFEQKGAFTGEISPSMLKSIGVDMCLVGHSERRQYFQEDDETVARKARACADLGITPIICVGENQHERDNGQQNQVVEKQLAAVLTNFPLEKSFLLAYEPVWAIGTGQNASPDEAQLMHAFIRGYISQMHAMWAETPLLYGGSCNDSNAHSMFAQPDVNGGLVGSASLSATSFIRIAQSFR
jgi:triosephosphate isomerase